MYHMECHGIWKKNDDLIKSSVNIKLQKAIRISHNFSCFNLNTKPLLCSAYFAKKIWKELFTAF